MKFAGKWVKKETHFFICRPIFPSYFTDNQADPQTGRQADRQMPAVTKPPWRR